MSHPGEMKKNDNPYLTEDGFPKALTSRDMRRIRLGNLWDTITCLLLPDSFRDQHPDGSVTYRHPTGHENYSGGSGYGR
jgi:hypothetical protein